jgi:hypothetical protein
MVAPLLPITSSKPTNYQALHECAAVAHAKLEEKLWWRFSHFLGFFTGGTTFAAGEPANMQCIWGYVRSWDQWKDRVHQGQH